MRYVLKMIPIAVLAMFALAACDSGGTPGEGAVDTATDTVNQAAEETKEAVDTAAEKVEDAADDATKSN